MKKITRRQNEKAIKNYKKKNKGERMYRDTTWPGMPGQLFFSNPYGVVVNQRDQSGEMKVVQGLNDNQVDPNISDACSKCIGSIYSIIYKQRKLIGSGTIIHLFNSKIHPQIQQIANAQKDEFTFPLGIVLTCAHLIRNNRVDTFAQMYFSLDSTINVMEKEFNLKMKLVPIALGHKQELEQQKEKFLDPVTHCSALHDNDIEILLLLGKSKTEQLKSARLSFPTNQELEELKVKEKQHPQDNQISHEVEEGQQKQHEQVKGLKTQISQPQKNRSGDIKESKVDIKQNLFLVGSPVQLKPDQNQDNYVFLKRLCPDLKNKTQAFQNDERIKKALLGNSRNYVGCSIIDYNSTILAVNGSAHSGMSGGPLVRVKQGIVQILGVLSSSATLPFLRGFSDFLKGYLTQGWGGFSPIQKNIQELLQVEGMLPIQQRGKILKRIDHCIYKFV